MLITPVTRINLDKTATTYVEGAFPITKSTHITTKGDAPGNYSRAVIQTAAANDGRGGPGCRQHGLLQHAGRGQGGVPRPPAAGATITWRCRMRWHARSRRRTPPRGHCLNVDRTHFQEAGAVKLAELVAAGVKADTARLGGLIALMK